MMYCIIGRSSSGKDTLYNAILKSQLLNIKPLLEYTTREPRDNEIHGVHYNFLSLEEFDMLLATDKFVEIRHYDSADGRLYYCTPKIILPNSHDIIYKTSIFSIERLINYYNTSNIRVIYCDADDHTLLHRAISRESSYKNPNYRELCRRFYSDAVDNSEDAISKLPNLHRIDTTCSVEQCVQQFVDIVKSHSGT